MSTDDLFHRGEGSANTANCNDHNGTVVHGVTPPKDETQVDHIDPKSKGGSGTPDNGQVLCRGCNLDKGAKVPETKTPPNQ